MSEISRCVMVRVVCSSLQSFLLGACYFVQRLRNVGVVSQDTQARKGRLCGMWVANLKERHWAFCQVWHPMVPHLVVAGLLV